MRILYQYEISEEAYQRPPSLLTIFSSEAFKVDFLEEEFFLKSDYLLTEIEDKNSLEQHY